MFSNFARRYSSQALVASAFGMATGVVAVSVTLLDAKSSPSSQKVVIIGGGTAGIGVAGMLKRQGIRNVTIVEPSPTHYYQPLWTLVGGGLKNNKESARPMKDVIARSKCDNWIQKRVKAFDPSKNTIILEDGSKVDYDYLVVAAGIQIDWDKVPGLQEGLKAEDSGVVSIYDYRTADKTWETFDKVALHKKKDGSKLNLLFTMSPTGIKCAGAPQKIMWILEDTLRGKGLRDMANVAFWTPGGGMFGVKHYSDKLEKIRQERGVGGNFHQELVGIDVANKLATFCNRKTQELTKQSYDMLHVAPHMSAPDFVKESPISDDKGWVNVDKHTLQHKKYENIFGLGDCTNTPNSKTAAAITSQAPVLVYNLTTLIRNTINGKPTFLDGKYNGYASCPLVITRAKTILAEFGYGGKLMETFGRETGQFPLKYFGTEGALQQRFFYILKEQIFPFAYWNLWTRGMWYGTTGPFHPTIDKKSSMEAKIAS